MPILSADNYDAEVVHDLSALEKVAPFEAANIIEEAEERDSVNAKVRKQLNRAGGTTRNAVKTLVNVMNEAKDNVRMTAALKVLELHGAQFNQPTPQQTLQVVVSSDKVNLGAIFNPRRTNG
jgi:hypothetical protein